MVDMANALSSKMSQISILYKQNTPQAKKQLIQLAKEIADDVKLVLAEAKKIADACQDKVLQKQVILAMESIPMLCQQLKIVTAVKVAEPMDKDSEKQMIICATNLMDAARKTLIASEIASIRVFRVVANVSLAIAKFRKTLYKKPSVANLVIK